jgi:AcrR family transcriptional regulator
MLRSLRLVARSLLLYIRTTRRKQLFYGRKIGDLRISASPKFTRDLPEARRQQLIEATARCLAKFGLAGTSVRHVAAEAGVSPGLVRHHFEGMQDLVAETYRATGKQVAAVLGTAMAEAGHSAEGRLRAFVDASFRPPLLDPDLLSVWLTFWSLTRTDPAIHAIHAKVYAEYRRELEVMFRALADEWKAPIDIRATTLAFTALLDGLWLEHCLDPSTFTAAEAAAIAHRWVDGLKGGRL